MKLKKKRTVPFLKRKERYHCSMATTKKQEITLFNDGIQLFIRIFPKFINHIKWTHNLTGFPII